MTEQEEILLAEFRFEVALWMDNVLMCAHAYRMCSGRPDDDEQRYVIYRNTLASASTFGEMLDDWSVYDLPPRLPELEFTPEETRVLNLAPKIYAVDTNPLPITSDWHANARPVILDFLLACQALPLRAFVSAWEVRSPEVGIPLLCCCERMAKGYRDSLQDATMKRVILLPCPFRRRHRNSTVSLSIPAWDRFFRRGRSRWRAIPEGVSSLSSFSSQSVEQAKAFRTPRRRVLQGSRLGYKMTVCCTRPRPGGWTGMPRP